MRARAWRNLMWTALAAAVVLAGAAVASMRWMVTWANGQGVIIGLKQGCVLCGRLDTAAGRGLDFNSYHGWLAGPMWGYSTRAGGWLLAISLWLPAGAGLTVSTFSAFIVYRNRHRPGRCRRCGYDLSGLASNTCPECGRGEQ